MPPTRNRAAARRERYNRGTMARAVRLLLAALAVASCAEVDSPDATRVIPEGYKESFVEVLGCRSSVEHDLAYVVVRTAPELASIYRAGSGVFPAGALVIKEQYTDARCQQLNAYTVMRKDDAGRVPEAGDWRFYKLDRRQRVLEQGKSSRCVACHQACRARDFVCGELEP